MKFEITAFSVHKTALIVALVMAIVSLIFILPFAFIGGDAGMPLGFMFLMPFVYFVMTYLMTALAAFIYNRIAGNISGLVFWVKYSEGAELASDDQEATEKF